MPQVGLAIGAAASWLLSPGVGALVGRLLLSTAVSAISSAIQKQLTKPQQRGIRTEITTDGGDKPMRFVLGWYATDGHMVCPPMSHGKFDDWSNAYLTYVIDLGNVPGAQLDKVIIDDTEVAFADAEQSMVQGGPVPAAKPAWWYEQQGIDPANPNAATPTRPVITPGRPVLGDKYKDKIWLRYHDGTETTPDPYLVQVYGPGTKWAEKSGRPWTADMVGIGTCYAVLTFRYSTKSFNGLPRCRFVMRGTPLYDPRRDSSTGGSGAQRWDQPATWATTTNGIVIAYNILRGIPIQGGPMWGYGVSADALPRAEWVAAMTAADQVVDGAPRWQAAWEVATADEPASVLDEVLKVCCAKVAESGGAWRVRVGPPAAPVMVVSSDDIIIDEDIASTPFPGLEATYNGIHASYPEPAQLWRPKDAPPRYNAAWEASDQGRRLVAELQMPACPWGLQVQRVMRAYIEEERRFRRHSFTLPPEAEALEPLDTIAVTWPEMGYEAKLFEIDEIGEDTQTLRVTASVIEVDPADYDWQPGFVIPSPLAPIARPDPAPVVPQYFTAEGITLPGANGRAGRPAARLRWGGWALDGITGVRWELRRTGQTDTARGLMADPEAGETVVTASLLPATAYEARISFLAEGDRAVEWTLWTAFTTPDVRVTPGDLDTTAPGRPAAVSLTSTPGELVATWTADAAGVAYSELEVTEAGANPVLFQTSGTRYRWAPVLSGVSYSVRRRAVDGVGNKSTWGPSASHTVASDTVPPAAVTGLVLTPGLRSIWLRWNPSGEQDLSHYEIREYTSAQTPGASTVPTYTTQANNYLVPDLGYDARRWYAVRAVDTSGNKGAWSAVANATTGPKDAITATDLQGVIDATTFASGIEPVSIVASLPTSKLTTVVMMAGKLYRWNGSAYAADVLGQDAVTAGTVAAGAINTRELAAGAVTASIIGVGDFTNLVPDDQLQDPAAWSGSGAVQPSSGVSWSNSLGRILFNPDATANQTMVSKPFAVTVGDEFWTTFQATFGAAASVMDLRAYLYFYNRLGAQLADPNGGVYVASATTRSTQIYENSAPIIVPSGAFTARWVFWYAKENTVSGLAYAPAVRRKNTGKLIVDGSVKANHITANEAVITGPAQIAQATIESGHVVDLVAEKIRGGTALLATVTVNGNALGTTTARAADPAARVNAHTTLIDPGKITISGSRTLADWRFGGDLTQIDGGNIAANTVRANAMEIGSRNVAIENITFEYNSPGPNQVSWTAGVIRYPTDNGQQAGFAVPAGSATWTSGILYIVFTKDGSQLWATTSAAIAFQPMVLILATYQGAHRLNANYGRTLIDGNGVKTDALLVTGKAQMGTAVVDTLQIAGNAVTVPLVASSAAITVLTTSWTDLATIGMPRQGAPTLLMATFQVDATGTAGLANLRVTRDGVDISGPYPTVTGASGTQTSGGLSILDNDLGSGPTTYKLQGQLLSSGAYTGTPRIVRRTMVATHVKR
ncbi:phage tail protein [Paracoccus sanguinis]|uniref:Putative phage tail protein n=1 Tax=Paracoccus sanguinis TaxID=1545044 RepID=A0A1H2SSA8_9RHOB|nr:phage tail protein [Paracoccus sanguinis]SDW34468.1 Putative phage tail protein [Paracoccus sanguinis]